MGFKAFWRHHMSLSNLQLSNVHGQGINKHSLFIPATGIFICSKTFHGDPQAPDLILGYRHSLLTRKSSPKYLTSSCKFLAHIFWGNKCLFHSLLLFLELSCFSKHCHCRTETYVKILMMVHSSPPCLFVTSVSQTASGQHTAEGRGTQSC